jgi:hypothetical protein
MSLDTSLLKSEEGWAADYASQGLPGPALSSCLEALPGPFIVLLYIHTRATLVDYFPYRPASGRL